ncbi:MAG TPA: Holliday junction branch migration protein RuvA [Candidatus Saccharimonadales bacterium]|nr:Holliday junction branch migration protein RuvA [Candidatus Saccharimonadales bacterium]
MISTLKGKVAEKSLDGVVIDCGGVGYGVNVTFEDYGALEDGHEAKLYIYEHIRENTHELYGFRTMETKMLFEQLLSVNGVGPKMALSILSLASAGQVRQAIASGDTKFISQASGVGKRVAERVVVDLKDKVGLIASDDAVGFLSTPTGNPNDEALQGLVALGFSVADAAEALKNIDQKLPAPERIKQALKN